MKSKYTIVIENKDKEISCNLLINDKIIAAEDLSLNEKLHIIDLINFTMMNLIEEFIKNMIELPKNCFKFLKNNN